jgi:hypothetical protein
LFSRSKALGSIPNTMNKNYHISSLKCSINLGSASFKKCAQTFLYYLKHFFKNKEDQKHMFEEHKSYLKRKETSFSSYWSGLGWVNGLVHKHTTPHAQSTTWEVQLMAGMRMSYSPGEGTTLLLMRFGLHIPPYHTRTLYFLTWTVTLVCADCTESKQNLK